MLKSTVPFNRTHLYEPTCMLRRGAHELSMDPNFHSLSGYVFGVPFSVFRFRVSFFISRFRFRFHFSFPDPVFVVGYCFRFRLRFALLFTGADSRGVSNFKLFLSQVSTRCSRSGPKQNGQMVAHRMTPCAGWSGETWGRLLGW